MEAALVLPLVLLLTFGFIEIGWYVNSLQILHDAARQGARAAVRHENSNAEVQATVLNSLDKSIDVDPSAVVVRISKLHSDGAEHYQVMSLDENELGQPVRVTVTVDCRTAFCALHADLINAVSSRPIALRRVRSSRATAWPT